MSKALVIGGVCVLLLVSGAVALKVHVGPVTVGAGEASEEGVLTLRGQGANFPIFPDEETLLDAARASMRHNEAAENAALGRAAARGAFMVNPGIRVRVLERRHSSPVGETARVEILEGGAVGKTGWTFAELVRPSAMAPADPCALLAREEVEQVLGLALRDPERGAGESCKFKSLQAGQAAGFLVTLHSGSDAGELYEAYKATEQGNGAQVTPLGGLGDSAYVLEKQFRMGGVGALERELNVRQRKTWLSLTAIGSRTASDEAMADLARKALARLP